MLLPGILARTVQTHRENHHGSLWKRKERLYLLELNWNTAHLQERQTSHSGAFLKVLYSVDWTDSIDGGHAQQTQLAHEDNGVPGTESPWRTLLSRPKDHGQFLCPGYWDRRRWSKRKHFVALVCPCRDQLFRRAKLEGNWVVHRVQECTDLLEEFGIREWDYCTPSHQRPKVFGCYPFI